MRLSTSLLLPSFIGAALAASDAKVYLFQGTEFPNDSNPPTVSAEQARLIFAQRLGASQYHSLAGASKETLSYINKFGGGDGSLFQDAVTVNARELVLMVEGVSSESAGQFLAAWPSVKPAFLISSPPSAASNAKLGEDLSQQLPRTKQCDLADGVSPLKEECWNGKSKIVHYDLSTKTGDIKALLQVQKDIEHYVKLDVLNVLVVLMPESSRLSKSKKNPYGSYEMPSQARISKRQAEEPMTDASEGNTAPQSEALTKSESPSNFTSHFIKGVPAWCHASLDACRNETNDCSGHGKCYNKRGTKGKDACFTCGCEVQNKTFIYGSANRTGRKLVYWGGAACQKEDISGSFWLLASLSLVLVGLVGWSINLLFSIGEEKLPGVIGAGVSSNRAK